MEEGNQHKLCQVNGQEQIIETLGGTGLCQSNERIRTQQSRLSLQCQTKHSFATLKLIVPNEITKASTFE